MHIPDGYLGPVTYGGLWSAMVPIWVYASQRVRKSLEAAHIPYLALASVFSLVAMVFAIPLPGGTTGHLNGSPLVAILLGPWPAILSISVALMIQALIFGEGGITALGANCFNIGFVGALSGYWIFRFGTGLRLPKPIAGALAAYLSLNLSGLVMAIELGLQTTIHPSSSYFPFPLGITLPAVMIPHLTVIGLLEGAITGLVLTVLKKGGVGPLKGTTKTLLPFLAAFSLFVPIAGHGHDFWIEKRGPELLLVFGHGAKREEFDPAKVKWVKALDASGRELEVKVERRPSGLLLRTTDPSPSLLFSEIDNGYWSKTIYGWKNLPKRKATRVVEANRSLFFTKALLGWGEAASKPLAEVKLDLVPLENPFESKAGSFLSLKVLYQGKPLSGVEVEGGDHQKWATTDKEGIAKIPLQKGVQLVSVSLKEPLKNDPDADYLSLTSTLTFEVTK